MSSSLIIEILNFVLLVLGERQGHFLIILIILKQESPFFKVALDMFSASASALEGYR